MKTNHKNTKECEIFSERLKLVRKNSNLTLPQIRKKTGVTAGTIYDWELRRYAPQFIPLIHLARVFNVSIDYLAGLTDNPINPNVNFEKLENQEHNLDKSTKN